ncbi:uncharacterized protein LOC124454687 isoform X2 [Xenia sp. Carnegie-2017]|uniref:uncharacterized protein LOC124454687 isoform X2 n=1 Tax=Xenia sp. Carnegie-2017 TaxID=2897299 RepID=UPI001F041F6C|nr:uncharacterized protein LOC124454687 isoform X2 [Xenia sp. Carnegie-2017]
MSFSVDEEEWTIVDNENFVDVREQFNANKKKNDALINGRLIKSTVISTLQQSLKDNKSNRPDVSDSPLVRSDRERAVGCCLTRDESRIIKINHEELLKLESHSDASSTCSFHVINHDTDEIMAESDPDMAKDKKTDSEKKLIHTKLSGQEYSFELSTGVALFCFALVLGFVLGQGVAIMRTNLKAKLPELNVSSEFSRNAFVSSLQKEVVLLEEKIEQWKFMKRVKNNRSHNIFLKNLQPGIREAYWHLSLENYKLKKAFADIRKELKRMKVLSWHRRAQVERLKEKKMNVTYAGDTLRKEQQYLEKVYLRDKRLADSRFDKSLNEVDYSNFEPWKYFKKRWRIDDDKRARNNECATPDQEISSASKCLKSHDAKFLYSNALNMFKDDSDTPKMHGKLMNDDSPHQRVKDKKIKMFQRHKLASASDVIIDIQEDSGNDEKEVQISHVEEYSDADTAQHHENQTDDGIVDGKSAETNVKEEDLFEEDNKHSIQDSNDKDCRVADNFNGSDCYNRAKSNQVSRCEKMTAIKQKTVNVLSSIETVNVNQETESHSELMMGKELQKSPRSSDGNRNAQHVSSAKQSRVSSLSLNYVDHIVKKNQPHELLKILPSQEIDAMPNSIYQRQETRRIHDANFAGITNKQNCHIMKIFNPFKELLKTVQLKSESGQTPNQIPFDEATKCNKDASLATLNMKQMDSFAKSNQEKKPTITQTIKKPRNLAFTDYIHGVNFLCKYQPDNTLGKLLTLHNRPLFSGRKLKKMQKIQTLMLKMDRKNVNI